MKNDQWRELAEGESLVRTVGCRHSNPDICKNHSTERLCAFVRKDGACTSPPKSWKRIFEALQDGRGASVSAP